MSSPEEEKKEATPDYRALLKERMASTVQDQREHGNWTYAFIRPQNVQYPVLDSSVQVYTDCSDGCRILAYNCGVPDDPAGSGYQDYGNSTSIFMHLHHYDAISQLQPGDICTFGYYAGEHHACMVYDNSNPANPQVWNMGCEGQPIIDYLSDEIAGHAGMICTPCILNVPEPPPTPQEILRSKTGFYAWEAWRLGEGPWKKYGKKNKSVRPDVPIIEPPDWWEKNAVFLANRKKGDKPTEK